MKSKIKMSLCLVAMLSTCSVYAQSNYKLEKVSVKETNTYERDDIALSSPTNIYRIEKSAQFGTEVLTQEDIQAHRPKDIFDLLNKATGLDLTTHGRKSPFFINMRGGGSITYIIDGAILPSTSNRILQKIPMIAIEEVQIIRSSTALSLAPTIGIGASNSGSGTNIGFVIIRTKQPKKTEGIISTYLEKSESHPVANGQSIYIGTTFGDTNGVNGYVGGMGSRFDRPSDDNWFDGGSADSRMFNGGIKYSGFSLNLMGYKDKGRHEFQRGITTDGTLDGSKWYYDPIKTTILSLDGSMAWNENQISLFSLSTVDYKQDEHNENFYNDSVGFRHYEEEIQTYSLRHNARFGDTFMQLGGQYSQSEGFGPNLSNNFNKFDTNVFGYAISIEQTLLNGDLVIDAGFRRDQKHIKNAVQAKNQAAFEKNSNANNDVDLAPANVYALGAVYEINNLHRLNARAMFANEGGGGDFDLTTKNGESLHEENQVRYEVGLEGNYTKYFNAMLTYFNVDIEHEKIATNDTYTINGSEYYYYTEQDTQREGLEIVLKGVIDGNTRYNFSWTHMLKNKSTSSNGSSESIGISSPRNVFSALISHNWNDYRFNISGKKVSSYSTSNSAMGVATDVNLGDYTRIDLNIAKDFVFKSYTTTAKLYGRNITDDNYATRYTTGYYYDRGLVTGLELTLVF